MSAAIEKERVRLFNDIRYISPPRTGWSSQRRQEPRKGWHGLLIPPSVRDGGQRAFASILLSTSAPIPCGSGLRHIFRHLQKRCATQNHVQHKSHAGRFRGIPLLRKERARMGHPSSVSGSDSYCLILGFTAE